MVEGVDLQELQDKANGAWTEFAGQVNYKDSLIPEPIFLDVEPDEIAEELDGPNKIILYKAWASRNVEIGEGR